MATSLSSAAPPPKPIAIQNLFFLSLAIPHGARMTSLFEPFAAAAPWYFGTLNLG